MNKQIETAIEAFGGIQAMADRLHLGRWNVSKWRTSGCMPPRHAITVEVLLNGQVKAADLVNPPERSPQVQGGPQVSRPEDITPAA